MGWRFTGVIAVEAGAEGDVDDAEALVAADFGEMDETHHGIGTVPYTGPHCLAKNLVLSNFHRKDR
jgi:hypothetical protein